MAHLSLTAKALLLGLLIAQTLSTAQVYVSNLEYFDFLTAVRETGYLAVPNEVVSSSLKNFSPAFFGGLFFTFTAGASLVLISIGLAWAWDRLFSRNRAVLLLLSFLLVLCLAAANIQGFSPLITGYLLILPFVVFRFTLKGLAEAPRNRNYVNVIYPFAVILAPVLILIAWKPGIVSKDRFLDIRDHLLLSNAIGRKVNAFYYENSLYSTRVFESPRQQVIRACRLTDVSDPSLKTRVTRALLSQDYLPLRNEARPDLRITPSGEDVALYHQGRLVLKPTTKEFLHNPRGTLRQYEARTARHSFLLAFTMFSIVFLAVLLLIGFSYVPCYLLSGLFWKDTPRAIKAGILWSLAFLALVFTFQFSGAIDLSDPTNLSKAMKSDASRSRTRALKHMLRNQIDISGFPAYREMLASPHVAERYWLAKTLGGSRTNDTHEALHHLLGDTRFNVVCMALESLGRRGNRTDIPFVLDKINTSDNWYEQWYAYRALKRLGWRQTEPQRKERPASLPPRQ